MSCAYAVATGTGDAGKHSGSVWRMVQSIELAIRGLSAAAEILVDAHGIPHLRAQSRADLFFIQGFNAGRDRLWQLDLWRKRGLGLLSADFGPGYLLQDRAARLFLYRGDMAREWAAYGTGATKAIVTSFVAGLNAFIDLALADESWMPPEFAALGTRPARWAPEDVVRIRSHALVRNMLSEVARCRAAAAGDLAADIYRKALSPPHALSLPEGLEPRDIPDGVEDVFQLATAAVTFSPERLAATRAEAWRWCKVDGGGEVVAQGGTSPRQEIDTCAEGSNNWAVAPSRTATGRPILASDPHRAHLLPSLRYVVHLTAPDLDIIGAGEPALPGLSLGHNGEAAFGLTIFPADQEDLYVYEQHPEDPERYRYGDGWETLRIVQETIGIRGGEPAQVRLAFTRHGPVIYSDDGARRIFALRTVWSEPGTAPYLASLAYMDCRTAKDFAAALDCWSAPSVNQVYADRSGAIAWIAAGKVPRRPNWDGLLPVPGDGRYEWDGFWTSADLPRRFDPANGFVYSANEMNLPAEDPAYDRNLGFEWLEPMRAERIAGVLAADNRHSLEAAMALQNDVLSLPAQRVLRVVLPLPRAGWPAAATQAAALLSDWDCRLAVDSAAALLFEIWWMRHLKPALVRQAVPDATVRRQLVPLDNETLLDRLERGPASGGQGDIDIGATVAGTLAQAYADCVMRLGDDPAFWSWGRLHHAHFIHPHARVDGSPGRDVGPLAMGGSGSTVMNATYDPGSFRTNVGATFRMVLDVGNWDGSWVINAPGQSGDPRSSHYDDLAALWVSGGYVPLLYSKEAVDRATRLRIRLRPS